MGELTSAQEIIKKEQKDAAFQLVNSLADLQDSLATVAENNKSILDSAELAAFRYADESLLSFVDSDPSFHTASPRSVREDDRKKILPGQHAGAFLQFGLSDGTTLRVNFWGGLRTVVSQDLRDGDVTLSNSHTIRTESVVGQRTHLNWQIIYPNGLVIDSWIVHIPDNKGSFTQSSLIVDGQGIDYRPFIESDDSRFEKIKKNVFEPIGKLVKLIPSSV